MPTVLDSSREALLARLLRMPLTVQFVNRKVFGAGSGSRDEVVTNSRLILIIEGEMIYDMEHRRHRLRAGTQFFVPAWVRRVWTVPPGGVCEIAWCEFDDDSPDTSVTGCLHRDLQGGDFTREKKSHLEMLRLYQKFHDTGHPPFLLLGLEAMLKAALGRFWMEADDQRGSAASVSASPLHPAVKQALRRFDTHYADRDALESVYARSELTPNYFRKHFKDGMKCSPQEYLQRLRLRHARHLIHSTALQQKRIAAEVGYDDPLYFSRLYTRFWGRSPSEERALIERRR
jgi:AraC-like DNA-binding protein